MASTGAPFQLAAHTERANKLVEKLYYDRISQEDYDDRIYATSITSPDRVKSVPIILTLDDTLATLTAYANRAFKLPPAEVKHTKLFVVWSNKTFHVAGAHVVPETVVPLDQDNLEMMLTFMQASLQVEQLLVEFEDVTQAAAELESTAVEGNRAEDEDEAQTPTQQTFSPPDTKDKGSPKGKGPEKGKGRDTTSETDREPMKSAQSYHEDLSLRAKQSMSQINDTKQADTQRETNAKKQSRKSGSSSDASKTPGKGHSKEESHKSGSSSDKSKKPDKRHSNEERRGNHRSGK